MFFKSTNGIPLLFNRRRFVESLWLALACCALLGCGTTKSFTATEQLLLSDAVDTTVSKLDFSSLTGRKVYLDATYLKTVKSPLLIDSDYVISSLRQQMVGAGVLLVEQREESDLIAEARIGALGMNGHDIVYGIPASNALSSATAAIAGAPLLPSIPEISLARREGREGSAKIAVFAYHRDSRQRYWQSGIAQSTSTAKDMWILGVGPFQKGTIHDGTRFAGAEVLGDLVEDEAAAIHESQAFSNYSSPHKYKPAAQKPDVVLAGGDDATSQESSVAPASDTKPNATPPVSK